MVALKEFCQSAAESLDRIRNLQEEDLEQLGFYAHKLRGGAENVNAPRIALRAERLEKAAFHEKDPEYVERLVASLEREIGLFLDHVKHL